MKIITVNENLFAAMNFYFEIKIPSLKIQCRAKTVLHKIK